MKLKEKTCPDCNSGVHIQTVRQRTRHLHIKEITFTCGARQLETGDTEAGLASVVLHAGACAS
jgi:hypothetical protein